MKPSRLRTLLLGLGAGVAYAFLIMLLVSSSHRNVSVAYIFVLPLVLGAVPVLFSTAEQLRSYKDYIVGPWVIMLLFFALSFISGFEGLICLVIIVGPFVVLGSVGGFIFRLIKLRAGASQTPLYASLLLPLLFLVIENQVPATDQLHTVVTTLNVAAPVATVWPQVVNVRHIQPTEIQRHFVHLIGVPRPLDGALDREGVGGIRRITWEKGIRFQEVITRWQPGRGFAYDIHVDPRSIPPTTLDEHVMIGGRYFDVVRGSYRLDSLAAGRSRLTLSCTYRVTTNLNRYSQWWADFVLNDFNETILEVIKKRSESQPEVGTRYAR